MDLSLRLPVIEKYRLRSTYCRGSSLATFLSPTPIGLWAGRTLPAPVSVHRRDHPFCSATNPVCGLIMNPKVEQICIAAGIEPTRNQKGKLCCPDCGDFGVSVNKSTGRAKCYAHGGCGWYWPKRGIERTTSPISEALASLFKECRTALVRASEHDGMRKQAISYLHERGVNNKAIMASKIGMLPMCFNPEPIISTAKRKLEMNFFAPDMRDARDFALERFEENFAKPLRSLCGMYGEPDVKTGVTSTSREGWLMFFYEDEHGDFVSVNFRKPGVNEAGEKVVRMWQPTPVGRGVFNPIEGGCTLGRDGERVLVMEGEFNQLQFLSAYARLAEEGTDWLDEVPACVTAGSSAGVDTNVLWKVIQNLGQEDQTMYAVVSEDDDPAGAKVTEQIAEGGFTYSFRLPKKDMDEFIKSMNDDRKALDEVLILAGTAELYYCPMKAAAERLNRLRSNPPDGVNGYDEEGKPRKAPPHILNQKIFELVKHDIQTRSRLFLAEYPYIYRKDSHELIKFIDKSPTATEFLQEYKLLANESHTALVSENLQAFLLNPKNVEAMSIHKLGCIQRDRETGLHTMYVNKGDGNIFRISTAEIEIVENGTGDIFMLEENVKPWPNFTKVNVEYIQSIAKQLNGAGIKFTPGSPLCRHLSELYDQQTLSPEECQQMSFMRKMFTFVANSCELWPISFNTGVQNSGKSTGVEKWLSLLYGITADGKGQKGKNLPPLRRDLIAGLTNSAMTLFDNIDSVEFRKQTASYLDVFCGVATGMSASMAMLYKNNVEMNFNLQTHLFLTARVCPIQRSDAMRRVIQLGIRKPTPEEHVSKDILIREMMEERDKCLLEMLVRLQNMVKGYDANHSKRYLKVSEMPEYEEWSYRLAEHEGILPAMQTIWQKFDQMYRDIIQESNPLAYLVKCWLGKDIETTGRIVQSNAGREVTVAPYVISVSRSLPSPPSCSVAISARIRAEWKCVSGTSEKRLPTASPME